MNFEQSKDRWRLATYMNTEERNLVKTIFVTQTTV